MKAPHSSLILALALPGLCTPVLSQERPNRPNRPDRPVDPPRHEELIPPPATPDLEDKALVDPEGFGGRRGLGSGQTFERRLPPTEWQQLSQNGWQIGVLCKPVPPEIRRFLPLPDGSGLVVEMVVKDSPAERAGIRAEDILVAIKGEPPTPLPDLASLKQAVRKSGRTGEPLELIRLRKGKRASVTIEPERPQAASERREARALVPQDLLAPLRREISDLRRDLEAQRERNNRQQEALRREIRELRRALRRDNREE